MRNKYRLLVILLILTSIGSIFKEELHATLSGLTDKKKIYEFKPTPKSLRFDTPFVYQKDKESKKYLFR